MYARTKQGESVTRYRGALAFTLSGSLRASARVVSLGCTLLSDILVRQIGFGRQGLAISATCRMQLQQYRDESSKAGEDAGSDDIDWLLAVSL